MRLILLLLFVEAHLGVGLGLGDLGRDLAERARAGFDDHNAEIAAADDRGAIVAEQARDRTVTFRPGFTAQNDLHKADIALRLRAENAGDGVDLAREGRAMLGELGVAVSEKVLSAAAAASFARFLIVFRIEDDLDRASHSAPRLRRTWRLGRADG